MLLDIKMNIKNQAAGRGDKQEAVCPEQIIGRRREAEVPLGKDQKAPVLYPTLGIAEQAAPAGTTSRRD